MKNFVFVSDFDGTLTHKDFYHIIIDKYLKDWGRRFYEEWKSTKKINVEFLNKIFGSTNLTEEELLAEILKIPVDENAINFIKKVNENNGNFYILSAGTSYYIELIMKNKSINNVEIVSMKGIYDKGGIKIIPDEKDRYFSKIFGVDKGKVVTELKKKYQTVFFAGDSEPDFEAAKAADIVFAKGELQILLARDGHKFVPVENFEQIEIYMTQKGWFSNENSYV